jgi:diguanylate cyclase (GGDEF)-like protein/PAS domain S-box-containing protein
LSEESTDTLPFRELAEASGDIFFAVRVQPDTAWEYISPTVSLLTGYPVGRFVADPGFVLAEVLHPDDRSQITAALDLPDGHWGSGELRWLRADGTIAWTSATWRARTRADGSRVIEGHAQDVTELRQARADAELSEKRYRLLTETMRDVVWIIDIDTLRVTYVSPSVQGLRGFTPEEVMAEPLDAGLSPEESEQLRAEFGRVRERLTSGEAAFGDYYTEEADQPHRDGTTVRTEALVRYVENTDTGHIELWGVTRDITDRLEAEHRLEQSERRFRLLAENASDMVVLTGADGVIEWMSPSVTRIMGWTADAARTVSMADVIHPDDHASATEVVRRMMAGQVVTSTQRLRTVDGVYRWYSATVTPILTEEGANGGHITTFHNVDDLVRERDRAEADEEILRATSDAMLIPQVLIRARRDEQGVITDFEYLDANRAACEFLGLSRDEIVGSAAFTTTPGISEASLLTRYAHALDTGEPLRLEGFRYADEALGVVRYYDISAGRVGDGLSLVWNDVTDRVTASKRIRESEERYRLLAENSLDVIAHVRNGLVLWVSPAITETLGWLPEDLIGNVMPLLHPEDVPAMQHNQAKLDEGLPVIARYRMLDREGEYHWVETHSKPYLDPDGNQDGAVVSFRVIDLEVRTAVELERRARFDDLTGAFKRDETILRLNSLSSHRREPGGDSAVLFVDVDDFKEINDTYGHTVGDDYLRALARRLREAVRVSDAVGRMGGDEFLVVLEGIHGLDEACAIAEKVRAAAARPVRVPGGRVTATVSVGVTLRQPDDTADSMIARADEAMYRAKAEGRNQVVTL